jgi:acetylglutamate kinase
MRTVVKVGGRVVEDAAALGELARGVASLGRHTVLVHGGGSSISAWLERAGLPVEFRDGLRVTSPEAMEITAMVLSGHVNKRLVAALLAAGRPAVGISGEDGALLRAAYKDRARLGEVGEIEGVSASPLLALLGAGLLPVVSPVSAGPAGQPLNVNADEAAIALAAAIRADRLLLVSDVPGVLVDGLPAGALEPGQVAALLDDGTIVGGMAVKVRQALAAARAGVEVRIGGPELLDDPAAGTSIRAARAAGVAA